jgi:beta-N-acetylhexosaminidase
VIAGELERLAAACLFPGFVGAESPPEWVVRWAERGLGGVVLFARNVGSEAQLRGLTDALHAARPDLVVATDEEGGDVTRLEAARGSSYPGNFALGVVDDVELTAAVAQALGADLRRMGIDLDFAPVADVNTEPRNPVIGIRSFGTDPAHVSRHVAAFVRGLQASGVAACAKHFPGHGDTHVDSHLGLPVVAAGRAQLEAEALPPFRAAIEAGVAAIMTAHLVVPALDEAPATVSPVVLGELLRGELAFDGLVMTDALEMSGLRDTVGVEAGALRALAAGADALCLGHDLGVESVDAIHAAILGAVADGRLERERLEQAAERVARVGRRRAAPDGPDKGVGLEAARRAVHASGDPALARPPFVVELWPTPSIAAGPAGVGLGGVLAERVPGTATVDLVGAPANGADLLDDARRPDRQVVLVLRDAHRHEWERETAEAVLATTRDAVVVELGLPLWRPRGGAAYVATHGAGRANVTAAAEVLTGSS